MEYEAQNRFLPVPENDETSQASKKSVGVNPRKHLIVRKNRQGKKAFITVFETTYGNTYCMNARTNQPYYAKFGSKDEDGLFSVILATGETGQTPLILFYDNPEQYERHFNITLSQTTKERWHKKKVGYGIGKLNLP
jgi:hypothetical protein